MFMKITILTVGKKNTSYLSEGESLYLKRLKHYVQLSQVIIPAEKILKNMNTTIIMANEAERLIRKLPRPCILVAMDAQGKQMTSEAFAKKIQEFQNKSIENLVFVIGGPLGLSAKIKDSADQILSLSKMTLMHDMVPLVLLEQLYRAFTIIRDEKYHK